MNPTLTLLSKNQQMCIGQYTSNSEQILSNIWMWYNLRFRSLACNGSLCRLLWLMYIFDVVNNVVRSKQVNRFSVIRLFKLYMYTDSTDDKSTVWYRVYITDVTSSPAFHVVSRTVRDYRPLDVSSGVVTCHPPYYYIREAGLLNKSV